MLRELGYDVLDYDPYYAPFRERLDRRYDFITVCEVAEHLADPAAEFARLFDCLNPGGVLGIMTSHIPPDQPFVSWHYQRDPTHICFYSESSLHWLAQRHGKQLSLPACNVALLF
jgi:2-polyprenyl-3-methyl-5-hydroxy-6-metoxy-1,4-benzoquinol methylase